MNARRGPMFAVFGLGALLLLIALVSAWTGAHRLTQRDDQASEAKAAAVAFVQAYGTFDAQSAASYTPRLASLTSGDLHQALIAARVDPTASAQQASMSVETTNASVTSLSREAATVSVLATQRRAQLEPVSGTRSEEVVEQQVACRLVRLGGRWLVVEFRLVSQAADSARPR